MPTSEQRLVGPNAGGGTSLVDGTIRREPSKTSQAMRAVLLHLEAVGFVGAPRYLGMDEAGRDMLSYVEGDTAIQPQITSSTRKVTGSFKVEQWASTDEALMSVGRLIRLLHEATRGFTVPSGLEWKTIPPLGLEGDVVGHMDLTMSNIVFRNGMASGVIDFENVGLMDPHWDLARAMRQWVPLYDPADLVNGLEALEGRHLERTRMFLEAYGVPIAQRPRMIDLAIQNADVSLERMRRKAEEGDPHFLREWTGNVRLKNRRGRDWVASNSEELKYHLASL